MLTPIPLENFWAADSRTPEMVGVAKLVFERSASPTLEDGVITLPCDGIYYVLSQEQFIFEWRRTDKRNVAASWQRVGYHETLVADSGGRRRLIEDEFRGWKKTQDIFRYLPNS